MKGQLCHLINRTIRRETDQHEAVFLEILDKLYRQSKMRIADVMELINCLDEIEELREAMPGEVENLVFYCIENSVNIYKLICLLAQSHTVYLSNSEQAERLRDTFTSVYAGVISLGAALSSVQECSQILTDVLPKSSVSIT